MHSKMYLRLLRTRKQLHLGCLVFFRFFYCAAFFLGTEQSTAFGFFLCNEKRIIGRQTKFFRCIPNLGLKIVHSCTTVFLGFSTPPEREIKLVYFSAEICNS